MDFIALREEPLECPFNRLTKRALDVSIALPVIIFVLPWVSLLVWPYFIEGVVRATSETGPSVPLAVLEILLTLVLFAACALHVRVRLRSVKP